MRTTIDRFVALLARLITRGLYRSVVVVGFDDLPDGPRLIVANHFNGFVDPVVLAGALGRLPRFIAKSTLWKTPGVPALMKVAGVLPVHRATDGGGDNSGTFSSVIEQLHRGHSVAIFPEGTTHDNPRMATVRTGAARLALDAAADGVEGMHIVPVGLTFEDKVALRSRVVVRAGTPIVPARLPAGSNDHEAVRDLTESVRSSLADVSPDFDSLLDAVELRGAANLLLRNDVRSAVGSVSLAEREALAAKLDDLPEADQREVGASVAEYHLMLEAVRVRDSYIVPRVGPKSLVKRLVFTALLVVLLAPFALAGAIINLLPVLAVIAAGTVASAPVSKGTSRVLAGVVLFPLAWVLLAVYDVGSGIVAQTFGWFTSPLDPAIEQLYGTRAGWGPSLLVFVACPLLGLLAVQVLEWLVRAYRTGQAVASTVNRRRQVRELLEYRASVVDRIEAARRHLA